MTDDRPKATPPSATGQRRFRVVMHGCPLVFKGGTLRRGRKRFNPSLRKAGHDRRKVARASTRSTTTSVPSTSGSYDTAAMPTGSHFRTPNITFDRTAGSHSLAAAGQCVRSADM